MDKDPEQVADLVNDAAKKEKEANGLSMQQTMMLIMNAGDAKVFAKEAIDAAKKGGFDKTEAKVKAASGALVDAYSTRTGMLTEEARGNHVKLTLLVIHAQDHLMTTTTYINLTQELVDVYKQMAELEK